MLKFRFLKMNPEATVYDWKEYKKKKNDELKGKN